MNADISLYSSALKIGSRIAERKHTKNAFKAVDLSNITVSPLTLPVASVTIQPTFTEVIQEVLDGVISVLQV